MLQAQVIILKNLTLHMCSGGTVKSLAENWDEAPSCTEDVSCT